MRLGYVLGGLLVCLALPDCVTAQQTGSILVGSLTLDQPASALSLAFGYAPSAVGLEVEYFNTLGDRREVGRSSAGGILVNAVVQPVKMGVLRYFGVFGVGLWTETFANGRGSGEVSTKDLGGGVRLQMRERIALRLDYRMFLVKRPAGSPVTARPQRFSVGLHASF